MGYHSKDSVIVLSAINDFCRTRWEPSLLSLLSEHEYCTEAIANEKVKGIKSFVKCLNTNNIDKFSTKLSCIWGTRLRKKKNLKGVVTSQLWNWFTPVNSPENGKKKHFFFSFCNMLWGQNKFRLNGCLCCRLCIVHKICRSKAIIRSQWISLLWPWWAIVTGSLAVLFLLTKIATLILSWPTFTLNFLQAKVNTLARLKEWVFLLQETI